MVVGDRQSLARKGVSLSAEALRAALRDPEHVPERLLLRVTDRLADSCWEWGESVRAESKDAVELAAQEYKRGVYVARINGAVAGTPFFIALVPAYLAFLEREYRLFMRMAALAGKNPSELSVAAEFLVLRGVHATQAEALAALELVKDTPAPTPTRRRPIKYWYESVITIMVYAGFLSAPDPNSKKRTGFRARLRTAVGLVFAGALWILTWIFPLTFMAMMSWTCERDARQLGMKTLEFWGLTGAERLTRAERKERRRALGWRMRIFNAIRAMILLFTLAIPFYLLGGAIVSGRWGTGWNVPDTAGAIAGLALVVGVTVATTWERTTSRG